MTDGITEARRADRARSREEHREEAAWSWGLTYEELAKTYGAHKIKRLGPNRLLMVNRPNGVSIFSPLPKPEGAPKRAAVRYVEHFIPAD